MEFKILTKLSYQQVQRIRMKKMKNIVEKLGFSPDKIKIVKRIFLS